MSTTREAMRGTEIDEVLRHLAQRTQGIVEAAPTSPISEALVALGDETFLVVNTSGQRLYQMGPAGGLLGHAGNDVPLLSQVHPDDLAGLLGGLAGVVVAPGSTRSMRCRGRHADGHYVWIDVTYWNRLDDPDIGGIAVRIRAVAEAESLEVAASLVDLLPTAVLVAAPQGMVVAANPAAADLLGTDVDDLRGTDWLDAFDAEARTPLAEAVQKAWLHSQPTSVEATAAGRTLRLHFSPAAPVPPSGWVATMEDVTDLHRQRVALAEEASLDALTGLPNRRVTRDRLGDLLADPDEGVAVLFVDLDDFKSVNDRKGHQVGDEVLIGVAARLAALVREHDIVSRWGGDEFLVVCPHVTRAAADALVARVAAAFERSIPTSAGEIAVAASVGLAHTTDRSTEPAVLVDRADRAMYNLKHANAEPSGDRPR